MWLASLLAPSTALGLDEVPGAGSEQDESHKSTLVKVQKRRTGLWASISKMLDTDAKGEAYL